MINRTNNFRLYSQRATFVMTLCFLTSCASKKEGPVTSSENMDVVEAVNVEKRDAPMAGDPRGNLVADAAFNWQLLFKGVPAAKERPALQQAIKQLTNASSTGDLLKRGRNEFALGFLAASESSFRQALRKDRKNIDALIDLAGTLQKQRRKNTVRYFE